MAGRSDMLPGKRLPPSDAARTITRHTYAQLGHARLIACARRQGRFEMSADGR